MLEITLERSTNRCTSIFTHHPQNILHGIKYSKSRHLKMSVFINNDNTKKAENTIECLVSVTYWLQPVCFLPISSSIFQALPNQQVKFRFVLFVHIKH